MDKVIDINKVFKNCTYAQRLGATANRGALISPFNLDAICFYQYSSGLELYDIVKALKFEYELNNDEYEKINEHYKKHFIDNKTTAELTCSQIAQATKNKFCINCPLKDCLKSHIDFFSARESANTLTKYNIPEFDVNIIPINSLKNLTINLQSAINAPIEYVFSSLITVLGATIGHNYSLVLNSTWNVYSNLFSVLIGEPSSKKSPSMGVILKILNSVEEETNINISISNATVEGTCKYLAETKKSVLIACDELKGWLNSLGEYKGKTCSDRQFYLTAWNCDKYTVLRKTTACFTIPKTHVSLLGSIQPQTLQDTFKYISTGDGFMERILWIIPPDYNDIGKYIGRGKAKIDITQSNIFKGVLKELIVNNANHKEYYLSNNSDKIFDEFDNELKTEIVKNSNFASLYGKISGLTGKLALIFQVYNDIETRNYNNTYIDEKILTACMNITRYFIKQFIAVYNIFSNSSDTNESNNIEDIVYSWLCNKGTETEKGFLPSLISTYKVARIYKADDAKNLLEAMLTKGKIAYNSNSKRYFIIKE